MGRKRPARVTVWLTAAELEELKAACAEKNTGISAIGRKLILGHIHGRKAHRKIETPFVDGGLFRKLEA